MGQRESVKNRGQWTFHRCIEYGRQIKQKKSWLKRIVVLRCLLSAFDVGRSGKFFSSSLFTEVSFSYHLG